MADSVGKKFEGIFKKDWITTFPGSFIYRLPDQMSGYKSTSKNICDFLCYAKGKLFLIECKTIKGTSFPFANFSQYPKMLPESTKAGIVAGVVIWFYEKDCIIFVPISSIEKMIENGEKSFKIKWLTSNPQNYKFIKIPSYKKRFFMSSDYSVLLEEE